MANVLQDIKDLLPGWDTVSSYFHNRGYNRMDEQLTDSDNDMDDRRLPPHPENRRRRAAFSAIHFQKEKIFKQIKSALNKRDSFQLEKALQGVDLSEYVAGEKQDDYNFLRLATSLPALDLTAVLLRYHADANYYGGSSSLPLHIACRKGHLPMCALLLSQGAKINLLTKYEFKSALHLATLRGHISVIELLLENKADVNIKDIYQETPLHIACRSGSKDIAELFIKHYACIDGYDIDGWTGLHLASEAGHIDTVKLLLGHNASIDSQTNYGRTALSWACASGQIDVVKQLLKRGADANIRDRHNKRAHQYAREESLKSLVFRHINNDEVNTASTIGLNLYIIINPSRDLQFLRQEKDAVNLLGKFSTSLKRLKMDENDCNDQDLIFARMKSHCVLGKNDKLIQNEEINSDVLKDNTSTDKLARGWSLEQKSSELSPFVMALDLNEMKETFMDRIKEWERDSGVQYSTEKIKPKVSYVTLLQIFCQVVVDYIASKPLGWEEFLKHINLPIDIVNMLNIKLKTAGNANSSKDNMEYILTYWAKSVENTGTNIKYDVQTNLYMKNILQVVQKCTFDDETGNTTEILTEVIRRAMDAKGGVTPNTETSVDMLLDKLSSKQRNTIFNEISQSRNTNIFPELEELVNAKYTSDSEATALLSTKEINSPKSNAPMKSMNHTIRSWMCDAINTKDTATLAIIFKIIVIEDQEELLLYMV